MKKVAVVHDWLTGMRGGEKVLEAILEVFPQADLFTLLHVKGSCSPTIENRNIYSSFVDSLPFRKSLYRHYLPFFPTAIESLDLGGYDLVLSSSHCVAKGIIPPPNAPHLSYIHSPMRYVWDMRYDYFPKNGFKGFLFQTVSNYLRSWDVTSSHRVDYFLSNSRFVGSRIKKYYGRDFTVLPPPCVPDDWKVQSYPKDDFYLMVTAFAPYKRVDLAIEAFRKNGKRLIIVGSGQNESQLRRNLPKNVEIRSKISQSEIDLLYITAKGFLFPGLEDFGITPVEAQSHGTPVIAYGKGGALETVIESKTGLFFYEQTPEALNQMIEENNSKKYWLEDFQKSINRFTREKFITQFRRIVDSLK